MIHGVKASGIYRMLFNIPRFQIETNAHTHAHVSQSAREKSQVIVESKIIKRIDKKKIIIKSIQWYKRC